MLYHLLELQHKQDLNSVLMIPLNDTLGLGLREVSRTLKMGDWSFTTQIKCLPTTR